jgi:hypothetical protein
MIETPGVGDRQKSEDQPHAKQIAHAPQPAVWSADSVVFTPGGTCGGAIFAAARFYQSYGPLEVVSDASGMLPVACGSGSLRRRRGQKTQI